MRGAEAIAGPQAVLLVGEMHGTAQVPDAVGRIACHAAVAPEAGVVLGIEMAADNQDAVNTFLASDGTHDAVASLLGAPHFAADMKDGRNSEAMVQLLESVRSWINGGANIDVVCFDAAEGSADDADARDAAMAHNLLAARKAHPDATLVVLSGNIHNRTVPGVPWDEDFVPMGAHLREAVPDTVSLDFRSAGGTLWACMGKPGDVKCGVAKTGGRDRGGDPFVELHEQRDDKGFDGILYVGSTTASKPAVPEADHPADPAASE